MKVKLLAVLLLAATIGSTVVFSADSRVAEGAKAASTMAATRTTKAPINPQLQNPVQVNPAQVIDGSKNPEKIPDHIPYLLLFRFLSGRNTVEEKNRARSYLKMVFACSNCEGPPAPQDNTAQIDGILAIAAEFENRVAAFDHEAKEIRDRHAIGLGSAEDKVKLGNLKKQKEALVKEIVASLPNHLGTESAQKLQKFINERMKPKVKLLPQVIATEGQTPSSNVF